MTSIEQRLKEAAENAAISFIQSPGNWLMPDYKNRVNLPPDFINDVWALVDREKVKAHLAARIEQELADRVMNHIAAEMARDVKQLLSNPERREAVRSVARAHLDAICNPKPV